MTDLIDLVEVWGAREHEKGAKLMLEVVLDLRGSYWWDSNDHNTVVQGLLDEYRERVKQEKLYCNE